MNSRAGGNDASRSVDSLESPLSINNGWHDSAAGSSVEDFSKLEKLDDLFSNVEDLSEQVCGPTGSPSPSSTTQDLDGTGSTRHGSLDDVFMSAFTSVNTSHYTPPSPSLSPLSVITLSPSNPLTLADTQPPRPATLPTTRPLNNGLPAILPQAEQTPPICTSPPRCLADVLGPNAGGVNIAEPPRAISNSPDINVAAPDAAPRLTDAAPRLTDAAPRLTDAAPRLTTLQTSAAAHKVITERKELMELIERCGGQSQGELTAAQKQARRKERNKEHARRSRDKQRAYTEKLEQSVVALVARIKKLEQELRARKLCAQCDKTCEERKCHQCRQAWYCSDECQREHWRTHKAVCTPAKSGQQ